MNIHYSDGFIQIVIIKMSFLYINVYLNLSQEHKNPHYHQFETYSQQYTVETERISKRTSKYILIYIKKFILPFCEYSFVHLVPDW